MFLPASDVSSPKRSVTDACTRLPRVPLGKRASRNPLGNVEPKSIGRGRQRIRPDEISEPAIGVRRSVTDSRLVRDPNSFESHANT